jgi:serine/threonine protein kinase
MVFDNINTTFSKAGHWLAQGTIFCDLDGTIVRHENKPSYDSDLILLPSTNEKLQHWIDIGYKIVICTARDSKDKEKLIESLEKAEVPYHELIMGLQSGPRYVINDRKPSEILISQAQSREVSRDSGIQNVSLSFDHLKVIKFFKGASLADTLLVKNQDKLFVRKKVIKLYDGEGYKTLKDQFKVMERLNILSPGITPNLLGEDEDSMEYYYDMEYLSNFKLLSECSEEEKISGISVLLQQMQNDIYKFEIQNSSEMGDWFIKHLNEKIYPKLLLFKDDPELNMLIESSQISIDENIFYGIKTTLNKILNSEFAQTFSPKSFCTVHGDLTLENVLINKNNIVKIIDMDGANFFDARELDFGKMMQSIVASYEKWAHSKDKLIEKVNLNDKFVSTAYRIPDPSEKLLDTLLDKWSEILSIPKSKAHKLGLFYLSLHLIRMTPFRYRVSKDQAIFALLNAVKYMNKSIDIKE